MADEDPTALEDLIERMSSFEAMLDDEEIKRIEDVVGERAHGVNRRGLLATAGCDSEKLFAGCNSSPEAFFELYRCSVDTVIFYTDLAHLLTSCHNRLLAGLLGIDWEAEESPFSGDDVLEVLRKRSDADIEREAA